MFLPFDNRMIRFMLKTQPTLLPPVRDYELHRCNHAAHDARYAFAGIRARCGRVNMTKLVRPGKARKVRLQCYGMLKRKCGATHLVNSHYAHNACMVHRPIEKNGVKKRIHSCPIRKINFA